MIADLERFNAAIARFDAANADDPTTEVFQGAVYPKELLYAQRMTAWLDNLAPEASEALRLAVRCQHIQRWTIPRHTYAMDRHGYLRWRTTLAKFHADTAAAILRDAGYDDATIQRVQTLLRKERLKRDPEVQCLEDVICLVFLEHYLAAFATQHDEVKVLDILLKTWAKMSPRGHEVALTLPMSPEARRLVEQALAEP
jgi:hypothetical protein